MSWLGRKVSLVYFKVNKGHYTFLKAATTAELDRGIQALQKRRRAEETKEIFEKEVAEALSNLRFLVEMGLLQVAEAGDYRERIVQARENFLEGVKIAEEERKRIESRNERQQSMEEYSSHVARQRALERGGATVLAQERSAERGEERSKE